MLTSLYLANWMSGGVTIKVCSLVVIAVWTEFQAVEVFQPVRRELVSPDELLHRGQTGSPEPHPLHLRPRGPPVSLLPHLLLEELELQSKKLKLLLIFDLH